MKNQRPITACLVSNSLANGYNDVNIKVPFNWENLLTHSKKFFQLDADIRQQKVVFAYSEDSKERRYEIMVLYDQNLHGTINCPYLAYKILDRKLEDVDRDDYMAVIKAVD